MHHDSSRTTASFFLFFLHKTHNPSTHQPNYLPLWKRKGPFSGNNGRSVTAAKYPSRGDPGSAHADGPNGYSRNKGSSPSSSETTGVSYHRTSSTMFPCQNPGFWQARFKVRLLILALSSEPEISRLTLVPHVTTARRSSHQ